MRAVRVARTPYSLHLKALARGVVLHWDSLSIASFSVLASSSLPCQDGFRDPAHSRNGEGNEDQALVNFTASMPARDNVVSRRARARFGGNTRVGGEMDGPLRTH
jgi:hypothetical protein